MTNRHMSVAYIIRYTKATFDRAGRQIGTLSQMSLAWYIVEVYCYGHSNSVMGQYCWSLWPVEYIYGHLICLTRGSPEQGTHQ